jgi:hypothetical protein
MNKDLVPSGMSALSPEGGRFRTVVPAALLLLAGLCALVAASLSGAGGPGTYAVVAPPGSRLGDAIAIIRAADGRLVQPGRFANIAIARSARPDFAQALRRAGAWAVIDAAGQGGCLAPIRGSTPS